MSEERPECDIEDLLCQIRVQSHLQGLQGLLGDDKFKQQFPEFEGLESTIAQRIQTQETSIREAFDRCGMPVPEQYGEEPPLESVEENIGK